MDTPMFDAVFPAVIGLLTFERQSSPGVTGQCIPAHALWGAQPKPSPS